MHVTPLDALALARAFAEVDQPAYRVTGLMEDESDYLALVELIDPKTPIPLGGHGLIFISKAEGAIWSDPFQHVIDKVERMRPAKGR